LQKHKTLMVLSGTTGFKSRLVMPEQRQQKNDRKRNSE
jgi:hypothetical protein